MAQPPRYTPLRDITTQFISRLRARDNDAWFELWEAFGPILGAQLSRWGRGRIGRETVQDLSQETMAALAGAIDRHDPNRGARFSTWLLAIARYTLGDELDRRSAQKRGEGRRAQSLDAAHGQASSGPAPSAAYEQEVFDAKVEAALREVEREVSFEDFEIFRRRVLEGRTGKDVADSLGMSQPTVSRRLASVRDTLRERLRQTVVRFSFTEEEIEELERNGLGENPNQKEDRSFEDSLAEIYHRISLRRGIDDPNSQALDGTP
ncbi:MAG TPA: sigma-70 family RNA polymerase sigma factor [Planctomycetota bacterium]|nr:sigma-70 family RNA polymerase sigma factor [Planctomycetota bacterium]